jgi:hypothetical protein
MVFIEYLENKKFMRKPFFIMLVCFFSTVSLFSQSKDEKAVRALLEFQTQEWNKGNIPAFMETYWKSDSLMFIGKSGVTYGWQKTLDNYKKNYPDKAAMGKLKFDLLQVKQLNATHFFVVGKWHLTRSIGDIGGVFSLLFRKVANRWIIIADHSS